MELSDRADFAGPFEELIDDLKLARPIKFKGLPMSSHALKHPLVFIGKCEEKFPRIDPALSGGGFIRGLPFCLRK